MSILARDPVVAGAFYPGRARELSRQVSGLIRGEGKQHDLAICVSPHAGYVYSGGVAGKVFGHLRIPRRVIVLGPNHTGLGAMVSVAPHSEWRLPTGNIPIDRRFAEQVLKRYPKAESEPQAHWREHSIEVQLPFLQARRSDVEVLPICLGHLSLAECRQLGEALAEVIMAGAEPVGIVVSSDMSHYVSDSKARELDHMAIDAALAIDPDRLFTTVREHNISMCGVIPATVALAAAVRLGGMEAHLVDYATSGDVSGDRSAVVGYAGICYHHGERH